MSTEMNNKIDFSKISLSDMLYFLNDRADFASNESVFKDLDPFNFSKVEMYEYIKFKTDNFDKNKFELFINDLRLFDPIFDRFSKDEKGEIDLITENETNYNTEWHTDMKLHEYIYKLEKINEGLFISHLQIITFSEIAENLYQTICEQIPGNTQEGTTKQKPFEGLLMELNDKKLEQLFTFLEKRFIDRETTDRQSFDYIFGSNKEKPYNFKPVEWKGTKQHLRELLTGLQKEKKYNRQNPETRELSNKIVRQTPNYFVKDGTPLNLAANKPVLSYESDNIKNFLATI